MASKEEIERARAAAGEQIDEHLRTPWAPSITDPRDAFLRPAPNAKAASIEALATPSGVFAPGREPGGSEYSWGRGLMPPPGMAPPNAFAEKQAIMRTNPADVGSTADYEVTDHSHSADGRYIARVREPEQEIGELP